jgi:hypothetical protein
MFYESVDFYRVDLSLAYPENATDGEKEEMLAMLNGYFCLELTEQERLILHWKPIASTFYDEYVRGRSDTEIERIQFLPPHGPNQVRLLFSWKIPKWTERYRKFVGTSTYAEVLPTLLPFFKDALGRGVAWVGVFPKGGEYKRMIPLNADIYSWDKVDQHPGPVQKIVWAQGLAEKIENT